MMPGEPLRDRDIASCVESLRVATANLERLSPAALSALARASSGFARAAKRRRRQLRSQGEGRRVVVAGPAGIARPRAVRSPSTSCPPVAASKPTVASRRLGPARRCYVCRASFVEAHFFYDSLCPPCAAFNFAKRGQTADLRGRVALVTGARVTSGHAAALRLLRAGATVIGTTRFARDAAARFGAEPDFGTWSRRLHLYGLDFRAPGWVEAFAAHVAGAFGRLDLLVNNAAQTVRRPSSFYAHLVPAECAPARDVDPKLVPVLAAGRDFEAGLWRRPDRSEAPAAHGPEHAPGALSALLSQVAVLPDDVAVLGPSGGAGDRWADAPAGLRAIVGATGGALDPRDVNSWVLSLGDVATAECLETLLVNAAAPFVLIGRLRALMARHPLADKWIVNVSAVEGQFSRRQKDGRHPHLNMAKAALNMLTRTSADDYARDRIFMNSVDVGWFSNGEPFAVAAAMRERGFTLPLDEIDAAARICDPVFSGVATGVNVHGKLLKDYRAVAW